MKKDEKEQVVERIIEQVSGLIRDHGQRIMSAFEKTENTLAVPLRISLKGDDVEISSKVTVHYHGEKISDWSEDKINPSQGSFEFKEEDGVRIGAVQPKELGGKLYLGGVNERT